MGTATVSNVQEATLLGNSSSLPDMRILASDVDSTLPHHRQTMSYSLWSLPCFMPTLAVPAEVTPLVGYARGRARSPQQAGHLPRVAIIGVPPGGGRRFEWVGGSQYFSQASSLHSADPSPAGRATVPRCTDGMRGGCDAGT